MYTEQAEIGGTMSAIKWDLKNIDWMTKNETIDTEIIQAPAKTLIKNEPLGVAAIYGAWNYPIGLTLKPLVQCITTGNCALIKPSEVAPATSAALKKLIDNHLDNSAYICCEGGIDVATEVNNLHLDLICFTGSTFVGKIVATAAAKNMTPCIMELGGKCPTIVDKSCDMAHTVNKICYTKFSNSG
jgi:aldehyde dehydrogenase (NAD+)